MKLLRKETASVLLSMFMLLIMIATVAFADEMIEITAFKELSQDVAIQEVEVGTTLDQLNLPDNLPITVTTGQATAIRIIEWTSAPSYEASLEHEPYTFTPSYNLDADMKLAPGVTAPTIEVRKKTKNIQFGKNNGIALDIDFTGRGYSWDASSKTLILSSGYDEGGIKFLNFDSDQITLKLEADITINETASEDNCIYSSDYGNFYSNLFIDLGGHTLTLITGGDDNEALCGHDFTIKNGSLVARLEGSGTKEKTDAIDGHDFIIENAKVTAKGDSLDYGGISASTLKLKQGAEVISSGKQAIKLSTSTALDLANDDISLTAIGSECAIYLDCDLKYDSNSNLKSWTNTNSIMPNPVGEGILLSSKSRQQWEELWWNSKYVYIGTEAPKKVVTTVTSSAELKNALEATSPKTIKVTEDIDFNEEIIQGSDHTLMIPNGKTVTSSGQVGYINIGNYALTINGGGKFVCGRMGGNTFYSPIGKAGRLNLENIKIDLNGDYNGINVKDVNMNSGALVTLDSTGSLMIRLNDDYNLNINAGSAIVVKKFSSSAIRNEGGTIHMNGGSLTLCKGEAENHKCIDMNKGLFKFRSGTLIASEGSVIGLSDNSVFVEGVNGRFIDADYTLTNRDKFAVVGRNETPSANGLTRGYYSWNSKKNAFEKQIITIEELKNITVIEGEITENLSVRASASNNATINCQWFRDTPYALVSNSLTYKLPIDLQEGTYWFQCNLSANGCEVIARTISVTVKKLDQTIYPVTVNNGTSNVAGAMENKLITITADVASNGKRFKEWNIVKGGVILENSKALTTSFTMPANDVEVEAIYEDIPLGVTPVKGVTLSRNNLSLYSNVSPTTATLTAVLVPGEATDKSVTWQSSNNSVASVDASGNITAVGDGSAVITVTTIDGGYTSNCNVRVSTYISKGNSYSSSSSNSSKSKIKVTENQAKDTASPVPAVKAKMGTDGIAIASVPDESISNLIIRAREEEKVLNKTQDDISIVLNLDMPKDESSLISSLSRKSLNSLVSSGVKKLEVKGSPVNMAFDQKALSGMLKQSSGNLDISISPQENISEATKKMIGSRPLYNITMSYGDKNKLSDFGEGIATIAIPYTLEEDEVVGGIYAVYVDENGKASPVIDSFYDENSGCLIFNTHHFSIYGVGYKNPVDSFIDINNHWAKESINYVLKKGFICGITESNFEPNNFINREILVEALGKIAGIDINTYNTSSFTDVKMENVIDSYIEWAYEKNIIEGRGLDNKEFVFNQEISREEIADTIVKFANAMENKLPLVCQASVYKDNSNIDDRYKDAIKTMQEAGIMVGGLNSKFNPKASVSRGEFSLMLYRYMELTSDLAHDVK